MRNVTLQSPLDRFVLHVDSVAVDSFDLTVERVDVRAGWGQELWATYFVEGSFASSIKAPIHQTAADAVTAHADASFAYRKLETMLARYFQDAHNSHEAVASLVSSRRSQRPTVLPLLRHLGGNLANVEHLWQALISSHPRPARAVVLEVGVADGASSMYALEYGVRVLAVEPNEKWIRAPILSAKAAQTSHLELIHAAASSTDGYADFSGDGTGGHLHNGGDVGGRMHRGRQAKRAGGKRLRRRGQQGQTFVPSEVSAARVPTWRIDTLLAQRNISNIFLIKVIILPRLSLACSLTATQLPELHAWP